MNQQQFYARLKQLSDQYYSTDQPEVTDAEFDALVAEYEAKFNTKFNYLGSSDSHHPKVTLPIYMASLNKCKTDVDITQFVARKPAATQYLYSEKLDGISLLVQISQDKYQIYTRGDGQVGSDVSHLMNYILHNHIPLQKWKTLLLKYNIDFNQHIIVRGELVIPSKYKEELGMNLRNIASGLVNSKTVDLNVATKVKFVAYNIYTDANTNILPHVQLQILSDAKFNVPYHKLQTVCTFEVCDKMYDEMLQSSMYPIDGVVIVKDKAVALQPGKNPDHAMAFKRTNTIVQATVTNVKWEASRYSTLHPTVEIEPVVIEGCTIQYASGFHAKFIHDNKVGPGSIVQLTRSGEVIPHIMKVLQPAAQPQMPTQPYVWQSVHIKLSTSEPNESVAIARLAHSMKVMEAKGVSDAIINKLYQAGFTDEQKLFDATVDQIKQIDGFKDKLATNVVNALQASKNNLTIVKLMLMSSYFAGFGEKLLSNVVNTLSVQSLLTSSIPESTLRKALATISITTRADNFIHGLNQFKQSTMFMQLATSLLTTSSSTASSTTKTEYTVRAVFTGLRPSSTLKASCDAKGIKYDDSSVTSKTTCVVTNDVSGSSGKLKDANKLNIPIYTVETFVAMYQLEN
ncbi:MAG: hypothetical protein EBX37_06470 [Alphaproteobacteria bacterium]|nr:hypothetical protein [Alphaproteobacteria bacterium]